MLAVGVARGPEWAERVERAGVLGRADRGAWSTPAGRAVPVVSLLMPVARVTRWVATRPWALVALVDRAVSLARRVRWMAVLAQRMREVVLLAGPEMAARAGERAALSMQEPLM